jgi:drug/metabolite transporter (DMT)-like permease
VSIGAVPLLLVAASSLSSSGFDLSRKLLGRHLKPLPMVFLLTLASAPLFGLAVALGGGAQVARAYFAPALGSLLLNIVANLAFVESVRIAPLSLTVPLLSLTPAFTTVLGFVVLGERPAPTAWLGVLLVVAGAFWLHLSAGESRDGGAGSAERGAGVAGARGRLAALLVHPGAWLMALTAFLWSLTIPLDKLAIGRTSAPFHGFFLTTGGALGTFAILAATRRLPEVRGVRAGWAPFAAALLASTLDLGFQLAAIRVLLVSVVETLKRGLGNLLAVALGRLVFGEALTWTKLAAAVLMAGGVALILR